MVGVRGAGPGDRAVRSQARGVEERKKVMSKGVYQRGSTWSYVVDVGVVDGKRRQQTKGGFPTRKAAELARAEVLVKVGRGSHIQRDKVTLGEFLTEDWLGTMKSRLKP